MPRSVNRSVVVREGQIMHDNQAYFVSKLTLDTGASSGNYIGAAALARIPGIDVEPCRHRAVLGDGKTVVEVTQSVTLTLRLYNDYNHLCSPITTELYVINTLGDQIIIGLPSILGEFYDFFAAIMERGRIKRTATGQTGGTFERIQRLTDAIRDEVAKSCPSSRVLKKLQAQLKKVCKSYETRKRQVLKDPSATQILLNDSKGSTVEFVTSRKLGVVYADDRVEVLHAFLHQLAEPISTVSPGEVVEPWSAEPDPEAEEILATPDPLSFSEDILHFMEIDPAEARDEYRGELTDHISAEMLKACPHVMDLMRSDKALDVFAPLEWNGMAVEPATFTVRGQLPKRLTPKARPVRPELYDAAKKEFERLRRYFYVESDSPIASPLVIAPKSTKPFIRFCGDYRIINDYIDIPQQPIPIVKHELLKAAQFKIFVDLDCTNSFHQIPLSPEFSDLLSVQTPWGLYRPSFLPEGVGPASGLLQYFVREAFADFADWTIVIFDNFLILADSYEDAYIKLQKIIDRCHEKRIVLKLKKSWIGVDKVTFFGYELTHGRWRLSDSRKASIAAMCMPTSSKEMQSFLGAALFFHNHVPDYTEWSARLYEMTHADFVWDPGRWTYDYTAHFERFKRALAAAAELHFPDYSLPWVVRCDASQYGVGAVLFQEYTDEHGVVTHQPIAFASKRFSKPATNWDAYKREAYACYFAIDAFSYYLRGKHFLLETDHRNLCWIEASQAPIVVRWRALMQSFSFHLRHVPGKENRVADWMSRMGVREEDTASPEVNVINTTELTLDCILQQVHGGRAFHYGAAETWRRAKELYPDAKLPIQAVREWVRECPMCQKLRQTGISGLPEITLSLKPEKYRSAVGVDHVTVTPADEAGNTCIILIVEHFSHFPQAYAAKDYTAESVARVLFKHYCTFGCFDALCSDPGSAFMSTVVQHLNKYFGIRHKVSLIGRHESNGCEGSGKQFLRHLRSLVADERIARMWSDDTVLPLINFELASYPTSETGGYTPFQLKYGTQDASYFRLPEGLTPGEDIPTLIRKLDKNIRAVREQSLKLQYEIAEERRSQDKPHTTYEPGDLVLWNPREKSSDHLPNKLDSNWMGPYEVINHIKNDVECRHLVLKTEHKFHVSRVKPFFGSYEDGIRCAKLDQNQYYIKYIKYYTGNPHVRTSMTFTIMWEDGEASIPWNTDLAATQQYEEYINSRPELFPLRYTADEAKRRISAINKLCITTVQPGDILYLSLRYFDGLNNMWYDSLNLPEMDKTYVVEISVSELTGRSNNKVKVICTAFNDIYILSHYDILAYCTSKLLVSEQVILVTSSSRKEFPAIFA